INFSVAPLSKSPSSTISMPFCCSLESFIDKYIELWSTRATKHWAIDRILGETDVEAVLRFKNPLPSLSRRHRPLSSFLPSHVSRVLDAAALVTPWFLLLTSLVEEHGSCLCLSSLVSWKLKMFSKWWLRFVWWKPSSSFLLPSS